MTSDIRDLSAKINIPPAQPPSIISQRADLFVLPLDDPKTSAGRVIVIAKVIRGVPLNDEAREKTREDIRKALLPWTTMGHPNIVPLIGVAYSIPHIISVVTPYYEAGNVVSYLQKNDKQPLVKLVRDAAAGLQYLHSKSVLHKDLCGTKVLVDPGGHARLTEIGLGPVLVNHAFTTVNMAGVARWQAPEVILDAEDDPNGPYTKASDVYAFAMLIVEMITLERPFSHQRSDTGVVLKAVQGDRPRKPDNLDETQLKLWTLAERCWAPEPGQRPDMTEVYENLQKF